MSTPAAVGAPFIPAATALPPTLATRPLAWSRSRRIALREFQAGDVDDLSALHRDPRVRALLIDDVPLQLRRVTALFVERMTTYYRDYEGLGIWHASVLRPDPIFAGWFSLMPMADRPGEVEIGSRLLPSAWGAGFAQEGGEMMLDHAAEDLRLSSVWGVCHPGNRSALAVLAAMGFEALGMMPYEGRLASHHRLDLNAWRRLRNTPRMTRLRRALRSLPLHRAATAS
jgi:RimJ/RimL family protein N-acetyltransferase